MKYRMPLFVLALWAVLGFAIQAQAAHHQTNKQTRGKEMTVTGCVAQGSQANQYQLNANGKTYNLMPEANVNLADHVGHKVKITGMKESAEAGAATGATPATPELRVTNVQHISDTCP